MISAGVARAMAASWRSVTRHPAVLRPRIAADAVQGADP
jgi:hypothetical protein